MPTLDCDHPIDSQTALLWSETLEIPRDFGAMSSARDEVAVLVAPLGLSADAVFDIKVALGEALTNAISHGAPKHGTGVVTVVVSAYEDRLVIEVSDRGCGFDPANTLTPDLDATRGRGIMFMRALMDSVQFESTEPCGTLVRLVKARVSDDVRDGHAHHR